MKEEMRTFKQLQEENSIEKFQYLAKAVTEQYATSAMEYSQTNIARDNRITKKALRQLMDYAIITNLVSLEIASKVLEKALQNQKIKSQEAGGTSIRHHKELIKRREDFLLGAYTKAEIEKIANDIASQYGYAIHHFTQKYQIESDRLTKKILERSIVENIVSDEIMEKLIERSLKRIEETKGKNRVKQYFAYLQEKRKKEKERNSH